MNFAAPTAKICALNVTGCKSKGSVLKLSKSVCPMTLLELTVKDLKTDCKATEVISFCQVFY